MSYPKVVLHQAVYNRIATDVGTDCSIALCACNAGFAGNVNNLVGTPYNVIDSDIS